MLKKTLRALFRLTGYSLVKNNKATAAGSSMVKVGNFQIEISNNNGLKYAYEYCKDFGQQLLRLTAFINFNYPNLEVIDIGANLGDSAALIKSGADVPLICIEGDDAITALFNKNTSQFKNITLIKNFLSDSATEMNCVLSKVGHNLTITPAENSGDGTLTKFLSLDILYANKAINNNCKLLKVDTEGFDLKIIRGGDQFIQAVKPALFFEFNRENLDDTETDAFGIFAWLRERCYNKILFFENEGKFMFSSTLSDEGFLKQLYHYVDSKTSKIPYMDLAVFHTDDDLMADAFIKTEEQNRLPLL